MEKLFSPLGAGLGLIAVAGIAKAVYNRIDPPVVEQSSLFPDLSANLPYTPAQFDRAHAVIDQVRSEWNLPLGPEDVHLMSSLVLEHATTGSKPLSSEGYLAVQQQVRGVLDEERRQHDLMGEAMRRAHEDYP